MPAAIFSGPQADGYCYLTPTITFIRIANLTDAVEKGVPSIETADPMRAVKTVRILTRRECWVDLSFSTLSTLCETYIRD